MNWNGIAGGITTGLNTYQAMAQLFAQKQKADQEKAVAQAYGQAMQSMANPAAIDLGPLGGKVQPQVPDMTMQNFARAMPQGVSPETFGGAANQFLPTMKADSLGDYRSGMLEERARGNDLRSRGLDYRGQQVVNQGRNIDSMIDTRAGQLDQGQQKIEIQNKRAALAERQAIITNGFREKEIQLSQQKGVNPVQKANFDRLKYTLGLASKDVTNIQFSGVGDIDAALAAQEALKQQLDSFDTTGVGLPPAMPANNGLPAPAPAPSFPVPPPGAILDLQQRPDTRPYFEKHFGPADKYLQPAPKPQSSLGAPPGPQGGPFVPMQNRQPGNGEASFLKSGVVDPAVAQRLASRTADRSDLNAANASVGTGLDLAGQNAGARTAASFQGGGPKNYPTPSAADIAFLKQNSERNNVRADLGVGPRFEKKYGPGSAQLYLDPQASDSARGAASGDLNGPRRVGVDMPAQAVGDTPEEQAEASEIIAALDKENFPYQGLDLRDLRIRRAMMTHRRDLESGIAEAKGGVRDVRTALGRRDAPTARPVTLRNPYMTMTEAQKSAEMRRLSIQMYAAKTARERAEVDKKLEQLLKASSPRAASAPGA